VYRPAEGDQSQFRKVGVNRQYVVRFRTQCNPCFHCKENPASKNLKRSSVKNVQTSREQYANIDEPKRA